MKVFYFETYKQAIEFCKLWGLVARPQRNNVLHYYDKYRAWQVMPGVRHE